MSGETTYWCIKTPVPTTGHALLLWTVQPGCLEAWMELEVSSGYARDELVKRGYRAVRVKIEEVE